LSDAIKLHNISCYSSIQAIETLPNIIILCVKDGTIEEKSKELAQLFGEKLSNTTIIHTAGVYGREVLVGCEKFGAITLSAHPFQTFAKPIPSTLENIA
jgi:predicted short-subunit dehydrogenase-like oxidoreductase (DUF2520 family)